MKDYLVSLALLGVVALVVYVLAKAFDALTSGIAEISARLSDVERSVAEARRELAEIDEQTLLNEEKKYEYFIRKVWRSAAEVTLAEARELRSGHVVFLIEAKTAPYALEPFLSFFEFRVDALNSTDGGGLSVAGARRRGQFKLIDPVGAWEPWQFSVSEERGAQAEFGGHVYRVTSRPVFMYL